MITAVERVEVVEGFTLREAALIVGEQGDRILGTLVGANWQRLGAEDRLRVERVRELLAWVVDVAREEASGM